LSLKRWSNAGIAWDGGCLMLNSLECHNEGVESSLSDVLETQGEHLKKYSLSPKAAQGILRRTIKNPDAIPQELRTALEDLVYQETQSADN
jgi:hypothetical protein